ncbi:hypothetical protein TVA88_06720 [Aeromonas hydrophila]|uniref:hypothetical protein n=1 Tax=Aeromonas hydrophila TaxID=644 RepID=UPI00311F4F80
MLLKFGQLHGLGGFKKLPEQPLIDGVLLVKIAGLPQHETMVGFGINGGTLANPLAERFQTLAGQGLLNGHFKGLFFGVADHQYSLLSCSRLPARDHLDLALITTISPWACSYRAIPARRRDGSVWLAMATPL